MNARTHTKGGWIDNQTVIIKPQTERNPIREGNRMENNNKRAKETADNMQMQGTWAETIWERALFSLP